MGRGKPSLCVNLEPVSCEGTPAGTPGHSPGKMKITTTSQESGPGTPGCEATPLVKSKGQQAEVTDSCGQGLSRVWKWGVCARAGTVFPHHLVFRQPWCLLTCLPSHTHR